MRRFQIAALLGVLACTNVVEVQPDFVNKTPYPNPESLRVLWTKMEDCSGLNGDFDTIHFYEAEEIHVAGKDAGGVWLEAPREIVVLHFATAKLIEHEMMHALLHGGGNHPPLYFNGLCGDLMNV